MHSKKQNLLSHLRGALAENTFWSQMLSLENESTFTLHLAIFREPYLRFIMEGKKTIETRFAKRRCPPYQRVSDGDVVVLKRSPGRIVGICIVEKVWFYQLDLESFSFIKLRFGAAICPAEGSFWDDRKKAVVATLMLVGKVTPVDKIEIKKHDRRGWVVFSNSEQRQLF
jgi:ASCH domain